MLVPVENGAAYLALTKDDKTVYYTESANGGRPRPRIITRSLETGEQNTFYEAPQAGLGPLELSPDNRSIAFRAVSNGIASFMVMPVGGGQPREVFRAANSSVNATGYGLAWSADGHFLYVAWTKDANTPPGLYRIPVDGGEPQDMGISMQVDTIAVRPDGRGIAFNALPGRFFETWMMENLPH